MKKLTFIAGLLLVVSGKAQESKMNSSTDPSADSSLIYRDFQLSFVTPLGTNGHQSPQTVNNFSFNIIGGVAAGLNGFELGSVANVETHYAHGGQIAGFANVVKGDVSGVQIAGFLNKSGNTEALQLAGFANVASDSTSGGQIAGFTNVSKGPINGLQISGFASYAGGDSKAFQLAGFTNVNTGSLLGMQTSGFVNVAGDSSTAIQLAGFTNVTNGSLNGAQVSGFANSCGDLNGIQISGFVNRAKKVKGAQIGIFNFSDSLEGAAIGIFSYVKYGYRTFEIGGNETFHNTISFKTGTNLFYNIISTGVRWSPNKPKWSIGYGVGTRFDLTDKLNLNLEGISYWIVRRSVDSYQSVNKLNLTVSYELGAGISVYGGPTFNMIIDEPPVVDSNVAPWSVYQYDTHGGTHITMYPGFTLGVNL